MNIPRLWFLLVLFALCLSACGSQDPEAETALPAAEPLSTSSEATPPERWPPGEALGEAQAQPVEAETLAQARAERQRLRERPVRQHLNWDEAAMRAELGLDAEQFQALVQARETLLQERIEIRSVLLAERHTRNETRNEMLNEGEGSTGQGGLRESPDPELRARLERAEQAWQSSLRSILSADQVQRLGELYPELMDFSTKSPGTRNTETAPP